MRPPLMRPAPSSSQSSSVRKRSLPFSSSVLAMPRSVSRVGWTSAASASSMRMCVKFWGLRRYSDIIRCFSQLKFSRSFCRTHAAVLFFLHWRTIQGVSWGCVGCALTTTARPCRRACARFVARIARSHRGRSPVLLPHSLRESVSTGCRMTMPPLPGGSRASTTTASSLMSQLGRGTSATGRPAIGSVTGGSVGIGGRLFGRGVCSL
mmetsp:Transcript_96348/g.272802  ORF Transcript_96348/g.272802 Transcript_96348/m.272802 type:complete len:208 (+) Transcript_96348:470-1093(+)